MIVFASDNLLANKIWIFSNTFRQTWQKSCTYNCLLSRWLQSSPTLQLHTWHLEGWKIAWNTTKVLVWLPWARAAERRARTRPPDIRVFMVGQVSGYDWMKIVLSEQFKYWSPTTHICFPLHSYNGTIDSFVYNLKLRNRMFHSKTHLPVYRTQLHKGFIIYVNLCVVQHFNANKRT